MTRGEELAWCAALFEGEGSLFFVWQHELHASKYCRWEAVVSMTDEDAVRRMHHFMGIGNVTGPHQRNGYRLDGTLRKASWEWRVTKQEDLLNLCALLHPLMCERRAAKMSDCLADLVPS